MGTRKSSAEFSGASLNVTRSFMGCLRLSQCHSDLTPFPTRWKIEAGFRKIKQEIGSAHTQTRNPDAVTNHLHFCMAATTITWIYAAHLKQAPTRRYASDNTTEFAFTDARRSLAKQIANQGFGTDCQQPDKPDRNLLISIIMRLVA